MSQGVSKLILTVQQEKPFKAIHALQFLIVKQQARSIDRLAVDFIPPSPDCIEVFKSDSPRIDFDMTGTCRLDRSGDPPCAPSGSF